MLLVKKCQFFCLCRFRENYTWNNASDFPQEKKTFWTIYIYIYIYKIFQSRKNRIFFYQGFNPGFWSKSQILLYLDLVIIRLERLLSDFAEKKETCFDYKKRNFSKSKKSTFPKGLTHAFGQKMPIIWFI